MREYSVSTSSSGTTDWIRMDATGKAPKNYTLAVVSTGTATYDVEFAIEKDLSSPNAIQHDQLKEKTASAASVEQVPATAFRLNVTAYTSGTLTLYILQGGAG